MKNKAQFTDRMKMILSRLIPVVLLIILICPLNIKANTGDSDDYQLKEIVVLSRHNIRAPLSVKGSVLDSATPHTWFDWSGNASELSLRGGMLETAMGQYFRKWMENKGLIPENFRPQEDEVRFYANAKQRTIATANYFAAGFLPVADIDVLTKQEYDKMDPVFNPQLTFVSEKYNADAIAQMKTKLPDLSEEYKLLKEVLDFEESEGYKDGSVADHVNGDTQFVMELNAEPGLTGSLKTGTSLSDALVLQFYEEEDTNKAAFGHDLTIEQWKTISSIKDTFIDVLYTTPLVSVNIAHPLLKEIRSELKNEGRLFSFLCGHDSNIASVMGALGVKDFAAPSSIESKTPIGSKLVFEKLEKDDEEYIRMSLVYNSYDQLRDISLLSDENPPQQYYLEIEGLEAAGQGVYRAADFYSLLNEKIDAYDQLVRKYGDGDNVLPKTGIE